MKKAQGSLTWWTAEGPERRYVSSEALKDEKYFNNIKMQSQSLKLDKQQE